jgi:hypothetical protein
MLANALGVPKAECVNIRQQLTHRQTVEEDSTHYNEYQGWVGRTCSTYGTEEKVMKYFGRKTERPRGRPCLKLEDNITMHLEEM